MLNAVASILMQLQGHEHILHFAGVSIINDLFLAFEYLQQGSLERYLEEHRLIITYYCTIALIELDQNPLDLRLQIHDSL